MFVLGVAMLPVFMAACRSESKASLKPPTVKALRLTHQLGGTHYRTLVYQGFWYQTFDRSLLVMTGESVSPFKSVELGPLGETGPAVDMAIDNSGTMHIVIEDDEVIRLSLETPRVPIITGRLTAATLGIRPRRLSVVNGEVYVSGRGGVIRLRDGQVIFKSVEEVSRVAMSEHGLIACIGRQVIRLDDGRYVGSASDVQMLNRPDNAPVGTILFARQGEQGVMVGLMGPDVRELDAQRATIAVPGTWRNTRFLKDRLWIITDELVAGYKVVEGTLIEPIYMNAMGAIDADMVADNRVALAGSFGRALYRLESDSIGPAETFWQVHREASRLSHAASDGRHVLAGSREGMWMYLVNARAELTLRPFESPPPPPQTAAVIAGAQAVISEDQLTLTIGGGAVSADGQAHVEHTEGPDCKLHTVVAVDGDFWIGHDRGITVLREGPPTPVAIDPKTKEPAIVVAPFHVAGRLRFAGPVKYLHPLLVGGGASFVSEFGGFGVATMVETPMPVAAAPK